MSTLKVLLVLLMLATLYSTTYVAGYVPTDNNLDNAIAKLPVIGQVFTNWVNYNNGPD